MSGFGRVISGGERMTKGLSKGINDKLEGRKADDSRRAKIATAVKDVYKIRTYSDQHTNNSNKGKFQKPDVPSKV